MTDLIPAMTLADLKEDLAELLGNDFYDLSFESRRILEAINWAQEQLCTRLGMTYVDPSLEIPLPDPSTLPPGAIPGLTYTTPASCILVKVAWIEPV